MGAFFEILNSLQLEVDIYHNAKFCGRFEISESKLGKTVFHLVFSGECLLEIPGEEPTVLEEGDLVLFPKEIPHTLKAIPNAELERDWQDCGERQESLVHTTSRPGMGMLCGEFRLNGPLQTAFLESLPEFIILCHKEFTKEKSNWLLFIKDLLYEESKSQSLLTDVVVNKLSEALFSKVLEYELKQNKMSQFLSLYSHDELCIAVDAFHEKPHEDWTIERMASICNTSRARFAQLFKQVSSWTPHRYMVWWRMQLAYHAFKRGDTVSQVCEQTGYYSEASFIRVFKREFSATPSQFKKQWKQKL